MKKFSIHSLKIENFRGVRRAELAPVDPGVLVVVGDNESGKSTLLDAFLLLLTAKYSSRKKWIKDARPQGHQVALIVEAELTLGEYRVRMKKRFLEGASAELSILSPHRENLTGTDAESRFAELVESNMDSKLRDALFVKQGESWESIPGVEIGALTDALSGKDADSSDFLGSEDAQEIFDRVKKERERYFTPKGTTPKGDYADAEKALDAAKEELEGYKEQLRQVNDKLNQLSREEKRIADYKNRLPDLELEQKNRAGILEKAKEKEGRRQSLQQSVDLAEGALEREKQAHDVRLDAVRELETLGHDLEIRQHEFEEAEAEQKSVKQQIDLLSSRARTISDLHDVADSKRTWLKKNAEHFSNLAALEVDRELLEDIEAQQAQRTELEARLAQILVTQDSVQEMHDARNDLEIKRGVIENLSTSVQVELPEGEEFVVDGAAKRRDREETSGTEYRVDAATTFGFGAEQQYRVTITPVSDAESARREIELVEARLAALLKDAQANTLDEAQVQLRERRDLEAELGSVTQQMKKQLKDRDIEQLRSALSIQEETRWRTKESIERALQIFRDKVGTIVEKYGTGMPNNETSAVEFTELCEIPELNSENVAMELDSIDASIERLNNEKQQLASELGELKGHEVHQRLATAKSALEMTTTQHIAAASALAEKRQTISDDDLVAAVEKAEETVTCAREAVTQFDAENVDVSDLAEAESLWRAAQQRVENTRENLERTRRTVANLEGILESQRGLPEKVNAAARAAHDAELEYHRLDKAAKAADKLYQALKDARAELNRKYQAPLAKAFDRLARIVFPNAEFEVDKDLRISGRVIDGTKLTMDQLSKGAQEQVHLLARLAMASVTAEGASVPIFIDDALGFADSSRTESMNRALAQLGETHQVIITTCEETRFDSIPGARMEFMTDLKD